MLVSYCLFFMAFAQFSSAQVFQPGLINRPFNAFNTGPFSPNQLHQANNQFQNIPLATKHGLIYHTNNIANTNKFANTLANTNSLTSAILPNEFIGGDLLANVGSSITNIANGIQTNRVSYNFGDSPIPITVSGKSLGNQPIGLQIMADNLQVNGNVAVSGRMPLYGTVTINGNVPSDGKSTVNYGCGAPVAV
ncbi:hypothetical protein HW555_003192 [Spodoptera exigua]|uniref:Uncharacterized protein n=1 Tax=Spodoptera exigua TaxID=7107 RepID=A0A835LDI8_SPOEX|nr:hypothetical protein HW555_003192 [Spodoptera exigua]